MKKWTGGEMRDASTSEDGEACLIPPEISKRQSTLGTKCWPGVAECKYCKYFRVSNCSIHKEIDGVDRIESKS